MHHDLCYEAIQNRKKTNDNIGSKNVTWFRILYQANEKDGKLVLAIDNIVKMAEANGTDKDKIAVAKEISEKCKSPEIEKEYVESNVQPNIISISNGFLLCFI